MVALALSYLFVLVTPAVHVNEPGEFGYMYYGESDFMIDEATDSGITTASVAWLLLLLACTLALGIGIGVKIGRESVPAPIKAEKDQEIKTVQREPIKLGDVWPWQTAFIPKSVCIHKPTVKAHIYETCNNDTWPMEICNNCIRKVDAKIARAKSHKYQ